MAVQFIYKAVVHYIVLLSLSVIPTTLLPIPPRTTLQLDTVAQFIAQAN
jgi:hypothetical protein